MHKLTKEQMLSELMIKLETIEWKIDKLFEANLGISCEEDTSNPVTVILDSLKFDETYK